MKVRYFVLAALGIGLSAGAASAHHSNAMFDRTKEVELNGVVKEFQWTNPHSFIQVVVPGANGATAEWSVETSSPNSLSRIGWTRDTLKPGDKVVIMANPVRSGANGGLFVSAKRANGEILSRRQQAQ